MRDEIRLAVRTLKKSPGFTAIVIATLAVAIGANTAIFSVVNGVLLKPLPFHEADRLVGVWHTAPGLGFPVLNASASSYVTYREEGRVFEQLGLWNGASLTITGLGEPEQVDGLQFTEGVIPLLRVAPLMGRTFTAADVEVGSPDTLILSYAYWQRRFGGASDTVGKKLTVNGKPREIIGVLPKEFRFLDERGQIFLPLQFKRSELFVGGFNMMGVARLKPGVTLEQANADVARMLPLVAEKFPMPVGFTKAMLDSARLGPKVRPFKEDVVGDVGNVLWVLMGVGGIVLLVACANVANLLLVRAEGRQQELAIRTALGADWKRIARQLLAESLTLGLAGGALGLGLAWLGIRLLVRLEPGNIPRLEEIGIDPTVLLYTMAVAMVSGLLFGMIPIFRYAAPQMSMALRENNRSVSQGRQHHRTRKVLVISQVALALVLLITSGLMLRTFQSLRAVQPGFQNPSEVLTMRISIPSALMSDPEQVGRTYERIAASIAAIPGVSSVGLSSSVTMDGNTSNDPIFVEDFPAEEGKLPLLRRFKRISPGTFQTVGNPIIAGRDLTWADIHNVRPVVLVSENLAREFWKEPSKALGRRIRPYPNSAWREIIGVVGKEHDNGVHEEPPQIAYWPLVVKDFFDAKINASRNHGDRDPEQAGGNSSLLQRGSDGGVVSESRAAHGECPDASRDLLEIDGADDVYAAHACAGLRGGTAAGRSWGFTA